MLKNTLQFVNTKTCEVHDEVVDVVVLNNESDEEAKTFDIELAKIMIHMKHQMLEALQPFFNIFYMGLIEKKSTICWH